MGPLLHTLEAPLALAAAGLLAAALAFIAGGLMIRAGLFPDHPNGRSSHARVTPRSGGLAIMAAWLVGLFVAAVFWGDRAFADAAARFAVLGFLAMMVGLADDRFELTPLWKLAGQIAAGSLFVWIFGAVELAPAPFIGEVDLGVFGVFLTILWIVAFMNVFNFMDGTNGLAASCGVFFLSALCVSAGYSGAAFGAVAALVLGLALIGFLPRNFPHARLFMGDGGSQGVGFLIAAAAVFAANAPGPGASALFAPTVMAAFLIDTGFTLAHRIMRRKNITHAHREHVYQTLLRLGASHVQVTAIYLGLTAVATTAAVLMLRLPPRDQWLAPALLILMFSAGAYFVFLEGRKRGFFDDVGEELPAASPTPAPHVAQAAE
ncbi:MAG: glycosyltransferase family 4 protein [Parvularculaceae bacterium]